MSTIDVTSLVAELTALPAESEWVEFKENLEEPDQIGEYVSALANAAVLAGHGRGYLVWGVEDASHAIVGTKFRPSAASIGNEDLEPWLIRLLTPRVHFRFHEGEVDGKRVVVLEVPAADHIPVRFRTEEFIRVGSYKKKLREYPEKERILWQSFARTPFEKAVAAEAVTPDDVLRLIDVARYYELAGVALPRDRKAILARLAQEAFIRPGRGGRYDITNLGAISFGKSLDLLGLGRKVPRVITYHDTNRLETLRERKGQYGYAAYFQRLIDYVNSQLPTNERIGPALRRDEATYPELAVRELVANALIHQDFHVGGTGPMVEIFADRVEITNPGVPLVEPMRFIDAAPRSRNEALASLLRRLNICEERGSGIDKVISSAEHSLLPAPDFRVAEDHTRAVLFAPRSLNALSREDRMRACYQHAALLHLSGRQMTNATLRERFEIAEHNYATASRIIADTIDAGLVRPFDPNNRSRKHARYVPFWA